MSVITEHTLEKAQAALNRIKAPYESEKGRLEIVTPDRYDEVYEILGNHFTPDEPLCRSYGVVWHPEFEKITYENLKDNCSVCMISKETDQMMGVRLIGFTRRSDPPADFSKMDYEPLRELFTFLHSKNKEVDFFNRYDVDEALHFYTLGVHKNYRRMGLGSKLLGAAVELGREIGFKAIKGEGTSNFSQRIYEKEKFDLILTMPYDEYTYKGRKIIDGTGEHTMTKVYGKTL
ncbi:uncharacterized protein LOC128217667 [Mya arenaria]|uniref:uncharacterized protein LOC128217667 n=1 Tax=Mya arenaria TaxID=6604 RepID=UPI0022E624A4|nr:uncharacterized protein LOC128217667 [Mya arenaria]